MKVSRKQIRNILERFSPEDFKDVYNTARLAHVGQTRRDGSEYFTHPSEVRNIARGFYPQDHVVQMAALLHDSLEDAPGSTMKSIEEMEEFIRGSIQDPAAGDEVIRVVRALTHEKGGDYTSYVVSLMNDRPALRVKLADMVHNLSDAPRPKQKMKYKAALDAMGEQTGGSPPPGISGEHWEQLYSLVEGKRMRISESQLRQIIRNSIKEIEQDPINEGLLSFLGDLFGGLVNWVKEQFQETEQATSEVVSSADSTIEKAKKSEKGEDSEFNPKNGEYDPDVEPVGFAANELADLHIETFGDILSKLSETDSVEKWQPDSDKQDDIDKWRKSKDAEGTSSIWPATGALGGLLQAVGDHFENAKAAAVGEEEYNKDFNSPAEVVKSAAKRAKAYQSAWEDVRKYEYKDTSADDVLKAFQPVSSKIQEILKKIAASGKEVQKESLRRRNFRLTEGQLRQLIREEIGRSFSTNADGPIPYWKTIADDVQVTVIPIEAGTKYACEIEVPSNPKLSSPMRYFPTEEEANHFARQYTEKVKNIITNEHA